MWDMSRFVMIAFLILHSEEFVIIRHVRIKYFSHVLVLWLRLLFERIRVLSQGTVHDVFSGHRGIRLRVTIEEVVMALVAR